MSDENITPETLPEGQGSGSPGSEGAVDGLLSKTLGKVLGKEFPDDQTALKAVEDTFRYVGKAGKYQKAVETVMQAKGFTSEEQAMEFIKNSASGQPVPQNNEVQERLEELEFYSEKPEFKPYKGLVKTFQKANPGKTIPEIVSMDEFKSSFEKIKAHDETEKQKSVLHSNSKLGPVTDKMTKAREAADSGNQSEAEKNAVGAVIDAFQL